MTTDWILVGVDGSEGSGAAVRWAAREASRSGRPVKLLHVAPQLGETVALEGELPPTREHDHERILVDAAATVRRALGDVPRDRVLTEVALGGRVSRLLAATADAAVVVLGQRRHRLLDRLASPTVLTKVAARAPVPVVAVPAEDGGPEIGRVVLGVRDLAGAGDLVDRAMAVAAERGARLVLLHAWQVPVLSDDLEATRALHADAKSRHGLQQLRAGGRERRAGVPVGINVVHGRADEALVAVSAKADLVLLGRDPLAQARGHLGATSRTVTRNSRCPVMVLAEGDAVRPPSERSARRRSGSPPAVPCGPTDPGAVRSERPTGE